ncbi:MAG: 50S ribosomal protein L23, partial [Oscillospiraceae bacterium]
MKFAQDIILRPIVTEESMMGIADKKYTFKVAKTATKTEVKEAVEKLFGVKVSKVNTLNVKGHLRRYGRFVGYNSAWKKAID